MANQLNSKQNQQQRKKKKGSGLWGLAVLAVIWIINRIDFDDLQRNFSRLGRGIRTGNIRLDGTVIGALAAAVLFIVLIVAISRVKKIRAAKRFDGIKARGGGTAAAHSHDQLQGYRGNESAAEHWKKQLDGFLEAGIIDRSEYRVLLERRRR
ncbi:MAG: hypothetical protein IJQ43_01855 [Oscillospiraceae bacterium]|nr:hypothetical protein [Oscillospiraceae bacterium]MBR0207625.1 hypothetical protein [Oscillospiraceae bacterium]